MNLRKQFLTNNDCYKIGKIIAPKGIMVHSTGANNPNLKRYVNPDDGLLGANTTGNHWNQPTPDGRQVCVHAFIGLLKDASVATYQTLPWNYRGWHAGGSANDTYIGFEICEDGLADAGYFARVYKEAVELCTLLCGEFKFNPLDNGVLICHSEGFKLGIATNHSDVMHWFPKFGKSMDTFRADVKAALSPPEPPGTLYRVQCGAFSEKANADVLENKLKAAGYTTYMVKTGALYKVQIGAFSIKANAEKLAAELKSKGFDNFITTEASSSI